MKISIIILIKLFFFLEYIKNRYNKIFLLIKNRKEFKIINISKYQYIFLLIIKILINDPNAIIN